jgi:hypothetical protein
MDERIDITAADAALEAETEDADLGDASKKGDLDFTSNESDF